MALYSYGGVGSGARLESAALIHYSNPERLLNQSMISVVTNMINLYEWVDFIQTALTTVLCVGWNIIISLSTVYITLQQLTD